MRYLRSSGPLAGAFLIDLGAMVFGMPRALFPALALTVYHGGATTVGYLNAAPGLGALIGSLLTGHVGRVRRVGRAVAVCVVGWGLAITAFGLVSWLPMALLLLVLAGAADVVSSVFRMIIVQQATPDALQGRVNSLVFAGLQGGPRLGDAESGAVADLAGPRLAAWSGGLLSVATAVATCWAIPQFWRYQNAAVTGPRSVPAAAGRASRPEMPVPRLGARAGSRRAGTHPPVVITRVPSPHAMLKLCRLMGGARQPAPGTPHAPAFRRPCVRSRRRWREPGPGWLCFRAP